MKILTSALVAVLVTGSAAHAASVTLDPTADGWTQTFGGDQVNTDSIGLTVQQSGGLAVNGILEYDLSGIADGSTINSASLTITLRGPISNTSNTSEFDVFAYSGDGTINIDDFDAAGTQVVDETIATAEVVPFELSNGSIINLRQNLTARGDELTFSLTDLAPISTALSGNLLSLRLETDSFATFFIGSLEDPTYAAATLTIDYTAPAANVVPLPAGLPLLLAGLGALGIAKRRKR